MPGLFSRGNYLTVYQVELRKSDCLYKKKSTLNKPPLLEGPSTCFFWNLFHIRIMLFVTYIHVGIIYCISNSSAPGIRHFRHCQDDFIKGNGPI